jgi:hypothetical protein
MRRGAYLASSPRLPRLASPLLSSPFLSSPSHCPRKSHSRSFPPTHATCQPFVVLPTLCSCSLPLIRDPQPSFLLARSSFVLPTPRSSSPSHCPRECFPFLLVPTYPRYLPALCRAPYPSFVLPTPCSRSPALILARRVFVCVPHSSFVLADPSLVLGRPFSCWIKHS